MTDHTGHRQPSDKGTGMARAALRELLDRTTRPVRRRRFSVRVREAMEGGQPIRIALGAGRDRMPGWIVTDLSWRTECFLDATKPWPVPPGTVEVIWGDNMIEHVPLPLGRAVLRHAYRALRPGGVMRLATPDVERVARQYLENGELARAGMARNAERGRQLMHPVELLRVVFNESKHYLGYLYDYGALSHEMEAAGFEVQRKEVGESDHPDLRGIDSRVHPAEAATILIVEGRKPV